MLRMAKEQFLEWLKNHKQCIWLVFVVFMYQYISAPLIENAELMGSPLGVLEPYIGLSNNLLLQTVIPVFFLILLSGFPEKYGTSYFSAVRIGRAGYVSSILTEAMGLLLCAAESPVKWIFPLSHGMFSTHFTKYYADEIVPVSYSILYFGGFLLIFYIACSLGIKKVSMTGGEGKV